MKIKNIKDDRVTFEVIDEIRTPLAGYLVIPSDYNPQFSGKLGCIPCASPIFFIPLKDAMEVS